MRKKVMKIVLCAALFVVVLVVLGFTLSRGGDGVAALPITQTIEGDTVVISISGNAQQRTVTIYEPEVGRTATITLTQQRRLVIRQRTDELPSLPRQQVLYSGEGLKIYRVGGLLIIYELQTGARHYI